MPIVGETFGSFGAPLARQNLRDGCQLTAVDKGMIAMRTSCKGESVDEFRGEAGIRRKVVVAEENLMDLERSRNGAACRFHAKVTVVVAAAAVAE